MTSVAATIEATTPAPDRAASAIARVEAHGSAWPALRAWRELESFGAASAYQSRSFVLAWLESIAPTVPAAPLFVVAYDADNRPVALLPLAVQARGPLRLAMFAGGKHSNLNLPLLRPGFSLTPDDARAMLRAAANAAETRVDVFVLLNQPALWNGRPNPFAAIGGHPSPSYAYGAAFADGAEAFLKQIDSAATRKKLKSKASKLATLGPVTFERAADPDRARTILQAFVEQKTLRFTQMRKDAGFSGVAVRGFLDALATGHSSGGGLEHPALDFYALSVGDRIVATYGGLPCGRKWHGLINSFNPAPDIARSSPAELLLRHIIRDLSARGFERFDLGIGESRYKSAICDETIGLSDVVLPASLFGHLGAPVETARLAAKRWVKHTPWALSFVEQMRAGPV